MFLEMYAGVGMMVNASKECVRYEGKIETDIKTN